MNRWLAGFLHDPTDHVSIQQQLGLLTGLLFFLFWDLMNPEKAISSVFLWVLMVLVTTVIAWDVWVITSRPPGTSTVSDQLELLFWRYPILAFIAGVLVGHVFHRSQNGH